jgi:hypothetical protein
VKYRVATAEDYLALAELNRARSFVMRAIATL